MKEKKLKIIIVLLIIVILALLGIIVFLISNNLKNKNIEEVRFIISDIKDTDNGYQIYAYELSRENRNITKSEYDSLLNGGTIKFRGRQWEKDSIDEYNNSVIHIKEKGKNSNGTICVSPAFDIQNKKVTDYYNIRSTSGKEEILKDYDSDEVKIFNVDKNLKVGDTFVEFEINPDTLDVKVKDFEGNFINGQTVEFLKTCPIICTTNEFGECIGYFVNNKLIALTVRLSTGP